MNEKNELITNEDISEQMEEREDDQNAEQLQEEMTEVSETKPKKTPLLDRMVKRIYEEKGKQKEEFKKVREIISDDPRDGDVWETGDGKVVISHPGIKKLADFVGAYWEEPRLDDKPNTNNEKGFYFHFTCIFPDGSKGHEVGSANDRTTKNELSNSIKYEMAYKRGQDRSFLNSSYMKMYDIYSADEADVWSKEEMLKRQLEQKDKYIKQIINQGKTQLAGKDEVIRKYVNFSDVLLRYVALPKDDEKYPSEYILTIIEREDYEYVQELINHEDKQIGYAASRLLKLSGISLDEQSAREETGFPHEVEHTEEEIQTESQQEVEIEKTEPPAEEVEEKVEEKATEEVTVEKKEQPKPFTLEPIEDDGDEFESVDFRLGELPKTEE